MAQQTAVEWFYQRILANDIKEVFEQAKAMEKEQIIHFAENMPTKKGITQEGHAYIQYDAEQHYKDTYENNK